MTVTTPVQTRLAPALVKALDQRATDQKLTRSEVMRTLLEAALDAPRPTDMPATGTLLDRIADEMGTMLARIDATLEATRAAQRHAVAAHGAAKLGALMLLPTDKQAEFVEKLAEALRS